MQALTATSARDGSFRVDGVTAGTVRAWASADGMLHAVSAVLEVPVHGVAEVELVLEPRTGADRIAGIVLDPVGEPVSGAGLAAMRHSKLGEQWVDGPTTGADGRFSIPAAHDSVYELSPPIRRIAGCRSASRASGRARWTSSSRSASGAGST
jgi:hypothetical protein